MPKIIATAIVGACLSVAPALAATDSPFTGTWKLDTGSATASAKPDIFEVKNGMYRCPSCTPAIAIVADGKFHKVAGYDYYDEMSVAVVDSRHIRYVESRGGVVVGTNTDELSDDGNTLTSTGSSTDNAKHELSTMSSTETRTGPAPSGAHPMSGTWKAGKLTGASDNNLTMTLSVTPTSFSMMAPTGEHYTAMFAGGYVPVVGDPARTMTKARMLAPETIETTEMRGGKEAAVVTYTVAADGKSLAGRWESKKTGTTHDFTAYKQ